MTIRQISESTPVTAAVAAAIVCVAFWGGLRIGELTTDVEAIKSVVSQLSTTATNHEARLAAAEAREQLP